MRGHDTHYVVDLEDAAHRLGGERHGADGHEQRLHHVLLEDVRDGALKTRAMNEWMQQNNTVNLKQVQETQKSCFCRMFVMAPWKHVQWMNEWMNEWMNTTE